MKSVSGIRARPATRPSAKKPASHRRATARRSAITVEELQRGVLTGPAAKKGYEVRKLKALLAQFRQIEFKPDAARRAALVRVQVEQRKAVKGQRPPGITDMLLAGHALSLGRAVATADGGFGVVAGLTVENWHV